MVEMKVFVPKTSFQAEQLLTDAAYFYLLNRVDFTPTKGSTLVILARPLHARTS